MRIVLVSNSPSSFLRRCKHQRATSTTSSASFKPRMTLEAATRRSSPMPTIYTVQLMRMMSKVLAGKRSEYGTFFSPIMSLITSLRLYSYNGPITPNSPSWMREEYIIHTRDALALVKHIAANPEFDGKWHTSPFEEFTESGQRRWSDFMSGRWAWKEAVSGISLLQLGSPSSTSPPHARFPLHRHCLCLM